MTDKNDSKTSDEPNPHEFPKDDVEALAGDEYVKKSDPITIVNEFAVAEIRKVHTRKGERLEIKSPKKGHIIRLDALELECLSWQGKDIFDEFLKHPHGPPNPENTDDIRPDGN